MPGEAAHAAGADGTRRAKKWLDATTRVRASWTNEDEVHTSRLEFPWPHGGQSFSFDLGGILAGDPFHGHFFVAESKKYSGDSDQGGHFDDFLARCYVTRRDHHRVAEHFMWITWHPFRVTTWTKLCTAEAVKQGLLTKKNRARVFDVHDEDEAKAQAATLGQLDLDLAKDVAERLWILVLSDKQESLIITPEHRALIVAEQVRRGEL